MNRRHGSPEPEKWRRLPEVWLGINLGFLGLGWAGFVLIDWLNVGELRDLVLPAVTSAPLVFLWIFSEAGPIEVAQWICLGFACLLSIRLAHRHHKQHERRWSVFFALGTGALLLMLLEDTVNLRHILSRQVVLPLVNGGPRSMARTLTELSFYAFLGSMMVAFLVGTLQRFRQVPSAVRYLLAGYVFYAVAAIASASRLIGNWYEVVGAALVNAFFPHLVDIAFSSLGAQALGFLLMDYLIEESLELIGAAALSTALLHLALQMDRERALSSPATQQD